MFHKTIQLIQINVRENLTGEVADWHSNALLLRAIAFKYLGNQFKSFRVLYPSFEQIQEHLLIHTVEELLHVRPPNIGVWVGLQKALSTLNGCEQPLTLPARPSVLNEGLVPDGNKVVVKQPMSHSVSHGRHRDFTPFIVAYGERPVRSVLISAIVQVSMKLYEVLLQVVMKLVHLLAHTLAFTELKPSSPYTP